MTHTLYLQAQNRSAVLERALRVTRHRGFDVKSLNMQPVESQKTIRVTVTVSGERPIDTLMTQLKKLTDVFSVHVAMEGALKIESCRKNVNLVGAEFQLCLQARKRKKVDYILAVLQ